MYRPFPIPNFGGGLVLADQTDILNPSQALDLLNVTFTERGAIRSRDGYAYLSTSPLTNQPDSIQPYVTSDGTKRLVVGNGNRLDVFTTFPGASAANSTAPTASPHFMVRYGSPTGERVYIANGTDQIRKLDGTTFTTPAGLAACKGRFLAVWQNRLVYANVTGTVAGGNGSSVNFSAPGDPEDFTDNTFEDLHPGDGESISGVATFGELLFVFKPSTTFVFTGLGTNSDGSANPDWRVDSNTEGLAAPKAVCAARDGLYFLDRKGVYKTTGSGSTQVSQVLDPFFLPGSVPSPFYRSDILNNAQIALASMCFFEERIHLAVPTGTGTANDRMLVFDPRYNWWTLWDIPASAMCVFAPTSAPELVMGASAATIPNQPGKHLLRFSHQETADLMGTTRTGGTAINTRWRSGWLDMGSTDLKTVRETKVVGEGRCEYKLTRDFSEPGERTAMVFGPTSIEQWGDGTDSSNLWGDGTDPNNLWGGGTAVLATKLVRQGRRGRVFSVEFSHRTASESWAIHSVIHHLRENRVPSVVGTEDV